MGKGVKWLRLRVKGREFGVFGFFVCFRGLGCFGVLGCLGVTVKGLRS